MKNYKKIIALVAAGIACTAISSNAALSNLGATGLVGGAPTQSYSAPFATTPATVFHGTFNSWVYANDSVASGLGFTGETFAFQANIDSSDILNIMTINGFAGVSPLGFGYNGATQAPTTVVQGGGAGQINIVFPGYTGTGDIMYLFTDVTSPGILVLDGVQDQLNATVLGYAPVPEPTTVLAGALMLLPLGVSTVRILRNRKTA